MNVRFGANIQWNNSYLKDNPHFNEITAVLNKAVQDDPALSLLVSDTATPNVDLSLCGGLFDTASYDGNYFFSAKRPLENLYKPFHSLNASSEYFNWRYILHDKGTLVKMKKALFQTIASVAKQDVLWAGMMAGIQRDKGGKLLTALVNLMNYPSKNDIHVEQRDNSPVTPDYDPPEYVSPGHSDYWN